MRVILNKIEKELPKLLELDDWKSIDINYHPPRVARVWRQWGDYRINLHRLHPCAEGAALFHPHPWPSIVRIIHGGYWTKLGESNVEQRNRMFNSAGFPNNKTYEREPYSSHHLFVGPGSILVDDNKLSWHSVAPTEITYSLMVTGKPWGMDHWKEGLVKKPSVELKTLKPNNIESIKCMFRLHYGKKW